MDGGHIAHAIKWIALTSSVFTLLFNLSQAQKKLFCYYGSEAQYRTYPGKFSPNNIDVTLCTHVIFAFADIENTRLVPQNWNDLGPTGLYAQVTHLKARNPSLRVLLAVGGWVAGYRPFYDVVESDTSMSDFAANVIVYLRTAGMDGLDMDWEFPGVRGSPPEDKYQFTRLMQTLYTQFSDEAIRSKRERLILTLASAVGIFFIDLGYETTEIHKYVDYMLLMTYNFHGGWDNFTAHHSTIFPSQYDQGEDTWLCQNWAVNFWISQGVPRSKILLGLATYGMSFTLEDARDNGLNAPVLGNGAGGPYTQQEGILAFYEICENLQRNGWTNYWIADQQVPYATRGDQWVGYDDVNSIRIKADRMINGYGLAGAFVWSVELDDFNGHCGGGTYPLLRTINDVIRPMDRSGRSLPVSQRVPPRLPGSVYPSTECASLGTGSHRDTRNCRWYKLCTLNRGEYKQEIYRCPEGLSYNSTIRQCDVSPFCV
ncbi:unnamed protein product [Lymnaea stagnalis]|uniref:Chitinase n=1 Tax=Lymnaea stagnalis TaxID=6523 RepID=A0AAV2HVP7_LYMST